jgi:hypothetical protein
MCQRLKRWESPRRQGRNHKGRGGSARQRQLKKQQQTLRKKLQESTDSKIGNQFKGRDTDLFLFCFRGEEPRGAAIASPTHEKAIASRSIKRAAEADGSDNSSDSDRPKLLAQI